MNMFNVRAYAIIIRDNQLLVADEQFSGLHFTKFPGGGLEFGEGLADCLVRECLEETGREVKIIKHFYTTDFFQESAFNKKQQLISVYYLAGFMEEFRAEEPWGGEDHVRLRWIPLNELSEEIFHWPVDKKIAGMLREVFL